MKFYLVVFVLCLQSVNCVAQDICGELVSIDTSFTNAYNKVANKNSPSAADKVYLKSLYFSYRNFFAENKATGVAAVVALKVITQYAFTLYDEKKVQRRYS